MRIRKRPGFILLISLIIGPDTEATQIGLQHHSHTIYCMWWRLTVAASEELLMCSKWLLIIQYKKINKRRNNILMHKYILNWGIWLFLVHLKNHTFGHFPSDVLVTDSSYTCSTAEAVANKKRVFRQTAIELIQCITCVDLSRLTCLWAAVGKKKEKKERLARKVLREE